MLDKAVLLMGPTAAGKTDVAIQISKRFPCDIISVDSALVYRGMDIGTAKPDAETLRRSPHQLIDIREPEEKYSAGDFVRDARAAIAASFAGGRIPLLVGGTMMYFRALTDGLAELPSGDDAIRTQIDSEAAKQGWPLMHNQLAAVDPDTAKRLNPNDSQRIQRALEVYRISGKSLSAWQSEPLPECDEVQFIKLALQIEPRSILHARIEQRLENMIASDFEREMRTLFARPGLSSDSTAMRSVGYRQFWRYLAGDSTFGEARDQTLFASRQLAKRQLTWLRKDPSIYSVDALEVNAIGTISAYLAGEMA